MAEYQLHYTGNIIIQHLADGAQRQIPVNEDNSDYLIFRTWDALPGNDPDPADPEPLPDPQEIADLATLSGLAATYQNLLDGLDAIEATKTELAADATTLSTITLTGLTLATLESTLQPTLRKLGTDLGVMIDNIDKLARGSETVLVTLRALKRNLGR